MTTTQVQLNEEDCASIRLDNYADLSINLLKDTKYSYYYTYSYWLHGSNNHDTPSVTAG